MKTRSEDISDDYPHNVGVISAVVGKAGGIGGFILSIMFGALVDLTGVRSSALSRKHPVLSHFT